MFRTLTTLLLFTLKIFLLYKVVQWIYFRINYPGSHPIQEIDWVLVSILLDCWLLSHTKIEITGITSKTED